MTTFTSYPAGTPCWVDLMTTDVDGAKAVLTSLFGWEAVDETDENGTWIYANFHRDGAIVAGLGAAPDGSPMPSIWNSYIAVDDVAATLEKATAAGGQVLMPPMPVMDAGEMAILADTTGAAVSLWKAGTHHGAQVANEANTWSWNELLSRDLDAAKPFYTDVFGWSYDEQDMGPAGTYHVVVGGEEGGLAGLMTMPDEAPAEIPSHWGVYFTVDDLDASLRTLADAGGTVHTGPMDLPGVGRMVSVGHPAGGSFSMLQPESSGQTA